MNHPHPLPPPIRHGGNLLALTLACGIVAQRLALSR
ncbi:hypothetical protein OJJOAM_001217 [Cupriavidus sp. H18C1]